MIYLAVVLLFFWIVAETFQEKSHARMMDLMAGGTTVLFVSHDLSQIRKMCDRVMWLDHGTVKMIGEAQEVCDAYAAAP